MMPPPTTTVWTRSGSAAAGSVEKARSRGRAGLQESRRRRMARGVAAVKGSCEGRDARRRCRRASRKFCAMPKEAPAVKKPGRDNAGRCDPSCVANGGACFGWPLEPKFPGVCVCPATRTGLNCEEAKLNPWWELK